MTTVYAVFHWDPETYEEDDHEKLIGVYSTEALANEAVDRFSQKPGFRDFPATWWDVHPFALDTIKYWAEGFTTVLPGGIRLEDEI